MDDTDATTSTTFTPTVDICSQLMQRYSTSSAPQHRHLMATAAAMKSLIVDDPSLTLSPLSYFAAAMSALSNESLNHDDASSSALATLLSIVLPLVPDGSISPAKAGEAVEVLVRVLGGAVGSTSIVKCVVKCLGVLLGFCDSSDWNSVKLPFQTLLKWSLDKRPKVRRAALEYLENAFNSFQSENVTKETSKLILSLLDEHMTIAGKLGTLRKVGGSGNDKQHDAEQSDIIQMLSVVRVALPHLSDKACVEIVMKLVELLDAQFSACDRVVLNAFEVFLNKADNQVVAQVAEKIITALSSYVTSKTNPSDNLVLASNLLRMALDKVHAGDISTWSECLSQGVNAIAGLLTHEDEVASKSSIILRNLIDQQISNVESQTAGEVLDNDPESNAIASMCSTLLSLLDSVAGIPNEHMLAVLSVLFLNLGRRSSLYMSNIVLKLAEIFSVAKGKESDTCHLQKCFGCAVVGMGAENVLHLVPITFNAEKLTCSNVWLVPILKKYIVGASLSSFMELIVPVAKSLQKAARKVKKSVIGGDLQAHAHALWGLLTAFCRYPSDIKESFQSFVELILVRLEKDTSIHEDIAEALQELITQNKCRPERNADTVQPRKCPSDLLLEDYLLEKRTFFIYSKKDAKRNIKALSLHSDELLQALIAAYLVSSPEKRLFVKKAISCLASISKTTVTNTVFISSLEKFPSVKAVTESGDLSTTSDDLPCSISAEFQWSLALDLASSFVKGADEDLVGLMFRLIKHALQAGEEIGVSEAYYTLSCILEEHQWFCSSKMDELIAFMSGLKSPADNAAFSNRLCCFRVLLVKALESSADVENTKPFLILNNIIVALKDSKEESRKAAYDVLLKMSSCFEESSSVNPSGPYYRLISMVMGYFSGSSPQITSAAVSALSVLVFKEPELCVKVPDVIPSVTSLLQNKAVEVIKAVLGFIKVLVSCLEAKDLLNHIPTIMEGLLPWSSVSRHHFRSKVTVILEILIRKCGFPALKSVTPERYQPFIKKVSLNRHGKTSSKDGNSAGAKQHDSMGSKKRLRNETDHRDNGSKFHTQKRQKQNQGFDRPMRTGRGGVGHESGPQKSRGNFGKGSARPRFNGSGQQKVNRGNFSKSSARPQNNNGSKFHQKER